MKKIIISIVLLLSTLTISAQGINELMSDLAKEPNVDNVQIGGFLLTLMRPIVAVKANDALSIYKGVKGIHVLNLSSSDETKRDSYISRLKELKDGDGYATIVKVKDGEQNVQIMMKKEKEKIKELCIFCIDRNEVSFVKLQTNIKDKDIQKLIAKYENK